MTEHVEEGFRSLGSVSDIDNDRHELVVEFPHGVVDSYNTSWRSGCFDESLNHTLPPLVWNHDASDLIGRAYKWESDGKRTRLFSRFSDFDAVPRARQAFAQIRDGDIPGFSFHFRSGQTVAHPSVRGAREFVKARMVEHSAVTIPSIPGAVAVGIRSDSGLEVPSIDEILRLKAEDVLDADGVRALIAEHHPQFKEHIRLDTSTTNSEDDDDDTGDGDRAGDGDPDEDAPTLASAVDAALDEAGRLLDTVDLTGLPDNVQQAVALMQAASVAVDELLDVMGVDDPDEGGDGGNIDDTGARATLSAADEKKLSDDDFAYIDSNGGRHLPIQDPGHVRNALARFDQTHFDSTDDKAKAKAKLLAAAKKFGVNASDSGGRSAGTDEEPVDLSDVLGRLAKY